MKSPLMVRLVGAKNIIVLPPVASVAAAIVLVTSTTTLPRVRILTMGGGLSLLGLPNS